LSNYLARILSGQLYTNVREGGKRVLKNMPTVSRLARRAEEHVKGMVIPGTMFEELGFNYVGPIDGHDIPTLLTTLRNMRKLEGPQFLHIITKKGKGYEPAEANPCEYHGVAAFDTATGRSSKPSTPSGPTYTQVFGDWLCDMASLDERLIGITPAMREGSGLVKFAELFPKRYFDVGIAEQHAVTLAAGLACEGQKPVVAIYSTFLQRAYDQLIHDVAIQNLPVVFAIDRAGLVGPDGPTHSGNYDISFLRCVPNMTLMVPADENEARQMLYTGFTLNGPSTVRYPRGTGPGVAIESKMSALPVGKGEIRRRGEHIAILAFGSMLAPALAAADVLDATVANMRFVKPLDRDLTIELATTHDLIVTIEENTVSGGAGSAVNELLVSMRHAPTILNLGIPDEFIEHGSREELLAYCGLTSAGIVEAVTAYRRKIVPQILPVGVNS
jgi:1-deoxy-D-xylulose-5-phosphate synthase